MNSTKQNIHKALHDTHLRKAVLKATTLSVIKRNKIVAELPDLEEARNKARDVRLRSLDNIDEYLITFTKAFEKAGGHVHFALDAAEANRIAIKILKEHNATKGVKSKSMVTEEIGLGKALEHWGIDAVESDLGEYIVQLAGEPPSHITAPALHRSRESIGRLFADKINIPYSDDPTTLTKAAREVLRQRFVSAQFGISGGNFLVAESGHLLIVENEGNVRLGLSLPPVYIAVTGIEKVIGSLNDVPPLMELLARSATGQRIPGYIHLLKPTQKGEDGPKEMHVILVDNGRRQALNDIKLREMLLCIRCGACLNICPVYRSVGGHAYGSVYPGPMGAIWSNIVGEDPMSKPDLPDLSTLCGACRDICPVKIDIPRMLLELRSRRPKPMHEQAMATGWKWTMETSKRFQLAGKIGRLAGNVLPDVLTGGLLKDADSGVRDKKQK